MWTFFQQAGIFAYPLGLCVFLVLFVAFDRGISLRHEKLIPKALLDALLSGKRDASVAPESLLGKLIGFCMERKPDAESLKAFAGYQVSRLERGLFMLDIVTAAAPLLGLLGTVMGLIQVFSGMGPDGALPESGAFIQGIALALTTTLLGLAIAIPSIVLSSYMHRRIDLVESELNIASERLIELSNAS